MSQGLLQIGSIPTRIPREEFQTLTDPFVEAAMLEVLPPGILAELEGYSRSYYSLEAHMASILKYDKPIRSAPNTIEWTEISTEAFNYFSTLPKVHTFSASSQVKDFDKVKYHEGTSAGFGYFDPQLPYPTHKGPRTGANYQRAKTIASRIVHECRDAFHAGRFSQFIKTAVEDSTPDIAFTRTQLVELPEIKVRNVFGECFHYVLLEGLFAYPLIHAFMHLNTFYYIGVDPIIGVPTLIESLPVTIKQIITIDWSSFDASVQPYEIELAFKLIKSILIFPDKESELVFDYVTALFCQRKLAAPDGTLFMRIGGIPSGSYFTHIVDSIINWIRIKYLFKLHNHAIYELKTHGDDALVVPTTMIHDFNPVINSAEALGWFINREKSKLCGERYLVEFLGRYSLGRENARETLKSLRLALYPEYPVTDPQISLARLKAIDEDSGFRVSYFPSLVVNMTMVYGNQDASLPRHFRRFNLTELFTIPSGI